MPVAQRTRARALQSRMCRQQLCIRHCRIPGAERPTTRTCGRRWHRISCCTGSSGTGRPPLLWLRSPAGRTGWHGHSTCLAARVCSGAAVALICSGLLCSGAHPARLGQTWAAAGAPGAPAGSAAGTAPAAAGTGPCWPPPAPSTSHVELRKAAGCKAQGWRLQGRGGRHRSLLASTCAAGAGAGSVMQAGAGSLRRQSAAERGRPGPRLSGAQTSRRAIPPSLCRAAAWPRWIWPHAAAGVWGQPKI